MDDLHAELQRKKIIPCLRNSKNVSMLKLLEGPKERTEKLTKFTRLKQDAKTTLLRIHPKIPIPVKAQEEADEEQAWWQKSQVALKRKQAIYQEELSKALKEEVINGADSDDQEDEESSDVDMYGDYLRKIKKYKKEEFKSNLLVDFSKKVQTQINRHNESVAYDCSHKRETPFVNILNQEMTNGLISFKDEFGRMRHMTALEHEAFLAEQTKSDLARSKLEACSENNFGNINDVHYNAEWEVRTRGVGFYSFSKDEQERKQQMEQLKSLDRQFKEQRSQNLIEKADP